MVGGDKANGSERRHGPCHCPSPSQLRNRACHSSSAPRRLLKLRRGGEVGIRQLFTQRHPHPSPPPTPPPLLYLTPTHTHTVILSVTRGATPTQGIRLGEDLYITYIFFIFLSAGRKCPPCSRLSKPSNKGWHQRCLRSSVCGGRCLLMFHSTVAQRFMYP